MSLNNMGLGFIFTTRDLASAKIDQLSRRFQSLDERVGLGANRMTGGVCAHPSGCCGLCRDRWGAGRCVGINERSGPI